MTFQLDGNTGEAYWQVHLKAQYQQLLQKYPRGIALTDLFALAGETDGFRPHPLAADVESRVEQFARQYRIWLEDRAEHYNTMTAYLHPSASSAEHLTLLGMYYSVLFYIDDVMGNEFRPQMSEEDLNKADDEIMMLFEFIQTGKMPARESRLVPPTAKVLAAFQKYADPIWLNRFIEYTRYHLEPAVRDLNSTAMGHVLSVDEYVEMRNHVSGMYPAIFMMEYAADNYLPREELEKVGLLEPIERLEFLCAAIGGLVNDFFSFEKEVLDAQSDFNLIQVFINNYSPDLDAAIVDAAQYVNSLYEEYKGLAVQVSEACAHYSWASLVHKHIQYMDESNMAVWVWQIDTQRYLRKQSIFTELRIGDPYRTTQDLIAVS